MLFSHKGCDGFLHDGVTLDYPLVYDKPILIFLLKKIFTFPTVQHSQYNTCHSQHQYINVGHKFLVAHMMLVDHVGRGEEDGATGYKTQERQNIEDSE